MLQDWSYHIQDNKHTYSFNGERNVILCSVTQYDEFLRLTDSLSFLNNFTVKCFLFIPHNTVIIADCEGIVNTYTVSDYE